MSLPQISPYPMPTADELPANRVGWRLDPRRAVLLVHDMQRHFLAPFEAAREPIPQLVASIGALRDRCRAVGVPVVYSAQPGGQSREQRGLLQDFWGDGIADGPDGQAIVDELAPADGDVLLTKWRYSALVRTDLRERLRAQGRDQLIVCGIYAHIGCLMTASHAFMEEVEPFFVADAVADFSAEDHRMAIAWAARRCAVVTTTARVVEELGAGAGPGALDRARLRADLLAALEDPPAALGDGDDLLDLGLDSIALMGVVTAWRERGVAIAFEDLAETEPTVDAWWAVVERALRRPAAA